MFDPAVSLARLSTRAIFDHQIGTDLMREPWDRHRFAEALGKDLAPNIFADEALVLVLLSANILWISRGPNIVAVHNTSP